MKLIELLKSIDPNKWQQVGQKIRQKSMIDKQHFFSLVYKNRLGPYGKLFFRDYLYHHYGKAKGTQQKRR